MHIKRFVVSCIVAAIISSTVFLVLGDFGVTWDEPVYFSRADTYMYWIMHPSGAERDRVFSTESEDIHPPLRKLLGGITHEIFTNRLHIVDNTRGYRISSLLFVLPFILVFSYIAIGQFGYTVGILTSLIFSFLPHVLFLAPLFTLDYAIAALWFLAVVFAMKGMNNYLWITVSGIFLGASLLTKFHGYLVFVPIVVYWVWYFRGVLFKRKPSSRLRTAVTRLLLLFAIAFVVYIALWPWLWTSTIAHLITYFDLQLTRSSVPVYILGHEYLSGPWWYTWVMFVVTTPAFVLVFLFIGCIYAVLKRSVWDRVILLNALYPILFFSLPGTYRYDWIRLFLPAYPFACLMVGRGIAVTISWLRPTMRLAGVVVVILLWLVTIYFSVIRIHPWESAYYNEIVGGIPGASRMGFETEFWGNAYLGVLPWMNWNKQNMMCVWPEFRSFGYYLAMGQLQAGVVFNAKGDACKQLIVLMRQGYFYYDPYMAKIVATQKPVYTVSVDGVALVAVYDTKSIKESSR